MENTILYERICRKGADINDSIEQMVQDAYKSGEAVIIAYLLDSIHTKNFTLDETVQFMYGLMREDKELKDYVYETMKQID